MYYFILGRNYLISVAEIISVLSLDKVNYHIKSVSEEVFLVETDSALNVDRLISRLGGVVKIGKIFHKAKNLSAKKELSQKIISEFPRPLRRYFFGFSLYSLEGKTTKSRARAISGKIKSLAIFIKNELKSHGFSSRWVASGESRLSSVAVVKNKIIPQGAEVCVLSDGEYCLFGRTIVVQPFESYSLRDYGREYRDVVSGMIPPKLAQILLNLAYIRENHQILDPFCGSGTVLQEAILMGNMKIIGSDASSRQVENTKKNIYWVIDKFELKGVNFKLFHSDVREIGSHIPDGMVNAVVTEPHLGPPLRGSENREKLEAIMIELSALYYDAYQCFYKLLKKGGRVVMIWPVFNLPTATKGQMMFLPITNIVEKLGFKFIDSLEKVKKIIPAEKISARKTLVYAREGQKVLREIVIFQKK